MPNAQTLYAILTTRPGEAGTCTLLEVDDDRAPLPQALEALYALADSAAQRARDLRLTSAHDLYAMRDEIERDRDRACDLEDAGVRYTMPDGTRLEACQLERDLLDAVTDGFLRAMLWTDAAPIDMGDDGETGGLENRETTPELRETARQHCARFLATANADDIEAHMKALGDPDGGHPGEYVGHTFYLTAAGHGVSFLDRMPSPSIIGVGAIVLRSALPRLEEVARTMRDVEHLCAYELADETVGI